MIFQIENYVTLKSAVEELCDFLALNQVAEEHIFDSKLVVYELLGNVLKHSGGSAKLAMELLQEYIELKVLAERIFFPPEKGTCAEVFSEHGRGLFLVDSVSEDRTFTKDGGILVRIKIK
ncbi:MAG: hypothetical protein IJY21_00940 [Clostridia bacterium]|nr:hypothetical protein [Clostridia bacterium]